MSDFEMLSALTESINTLWTIFSIYVSIVFAFLVASYLAAGRLARTENSSQQPDSRRVRPLVIMTIRLRSPGASE